MALSTQHSALRPPDSTTNVLLELAPGLSRCLLRLNPPQIAASIPNRGQRDRQPRRVSQRIFMRCLVDARQPWLASEATTLAYQSRNVPAVPAVPACCHRTSRSLHGMAWQAKEKRHAASLSRKTHHPIPTRPLSSLQTPASHFALGWTAAHSTLTPLSSPYYCSRRLHVTLETLRALSGHALRMCMRGTPDRNVITALSRIRRGLPTPLGVVVSTDGMCLNIALFGVCCCR